MTIRPELKACIDAYLDEVASHLRQATPEARAETVRELKATLFAKLRARSPDHPNMAELRAVLAQLPEPESFGPAEEGTPLPADPPRRAPLGFLGLFKKR